MSSPYLFAEAAPGGLVLDLQSGTLVQLNHAAALVWRLHLRGDSDASIAQSLVRSFRIPVDQAEKDVKGALMIPAWTPDGVAPSEFRYQKESEQYVFYQHEEPLLAIDTEGFRLSVVPGATIPPERGRKLLQGLVPKLLSLRGHFVLHASAVAIGGGGKVVAFLGASGAGKTTTAESLVHAGADRISQDKVVLRQEQNTLVAVVTAESTADAWSAASALALARDRWVACDELDAAMRTSPTAPLAEIGFLDVHRREADVFCSRRLSVCAAAGAIFTNSFHGSEAAAAWSRSLDQACFLAGQTPAFELTVPNGLEALTRCAQEIVKGGGFKS